MRTEPETFDYIVVGAGTAGSIVAARLAEDPATTVCVVEAGPEASSPYIRVPAGYVKALHQREIGWDFKSLPAATGQVLPLYQGRVVGGSSSINGMIYVRGQPEDFDHWASLGLGGWGYRDLLPHFERSETRIGFGGDVRGRAGPITVRDVDWRHPASEAFIQAAHSAGWKWNRDYNGGDQEGVAYVQQTVDRGRRTNPAIAILGPARRRANVSVRTNSRVSQIVFEDGRAIGIRYQHERGGETAMVLARREVVICCGAINTPRLMQVSGIGGGPLLGSIGVPVVRHLPGVGENLRDHFVSRIVMRARDGQSTLNQKAKMPALAGEVLRWLVGLPSALTLSPSHVFLSCRSNPDLSRPDLQCMFTPGSFGKKSTGHLDNMPGVTGAWWQHRPKSRGFVKASSRDVFADPQINPNYLSDAQDREVVIRGMRIMSALLSGPEMASHVSCMDQPSIMPGSDGDILEFCRASSTAGCHFVGTAQMGRADDPGTVVDDQLRVLGVAGLRIADASVMPTIPSANTYAPTMMIGEKAAVMMRGGRS